jgi:putative transposase
VEWFKARQCDKFLNTHWFLSLADALAKIEAWRRDHDESLPHAANGGLTPNGYAASV